VINTPLFFEYIPEVFMHWFPNEKPVWHILDYIKEAIHTIVKTYPEKYNEICRGVFVDKNVKKIDKYVELYGPALISEGCELRQGAFLRENVIIGNNCVIGNSTEIKNSVLFNNVEVPHFNYIGDSILGNNVHFGAGVKTANVLLVKNKKEIINQKYAEADKKDVNLHKEVKIKMPDGSWINTGRQKFGAIIGDYAEIGVNTTINPGTLLEMNMFVPSSVNISGYFKTGYIFPKNIVLASDGE
jgi:NDP-sugar pyrophosphorylase family protein